MNWEDSPIAAVETFDYRRIYTRCSHEYARHSAIRNRVSHYRRHDSLPTTRYSASPPAAHLKVHFVSQLINHLSPSLRNPYAKRRGKSRNIEIDFFESLDRLPRRKKRGKNYVYMRIIGIVFLLGALPISSLSLRKKFISPISRTLFSVIYISAFAFVV